MTDETRVCPICGHAFFVVLYQIVAGHVSKSAMVKCASCGEQRHWTHWKTPADHAATDARVKAFNEAVAAADRIFSE